MASNQLSDTTIQNIKDSADTLFGRVFEGYPCPLDMDQRRELSWCMYSPEELARIKSLWADCGKSIFNTYTSVQFEILGHPVRFYEILTDEDHSDQFFAIRNEGLQISETLIHERLGPLAGKALLAWVRGAVQISHEIHSANSCLGDILQMASTPGQLKRMLPDLLQYLNASERNILLSQTRGSSMPYEWAAYDRNKVNELAVTMAKCKLLPESTGERPISWESRSSNTWPIL
jgi:hypothetical protein